MKKNLFQEIIFENLILIIIENEQIFNKRKYFYFKFSSLNKILFRLNNDAKVYVGNVPTENLTDGELLHFFKPFGKISGF
jgi:RNA recognition motif-containing protein